MSQQFLQYKLKSLKTKNTWTSAIGIIIQISSASLALMWNFCINVSSWSLSILSLVAFKLYLGDVHFLFINYCYDYIFFSLLKYWWVNLCSTKKVCHKIKCIRFYSWCCSILIFFIFIGFCLFICFLIDCICLLFCSKDRRLS